jgi:hypothetical protein
MDRIEVTSEHGEKTFVQLEGAEKEVLSAKTGLAKDVVFRAAGREQ